MGIVSDSSAAFIAFGIALTAIAAGALVIWRMRFMAAVLVVAVTGVTATVSVLKVSIDRAGPSLTPWTPMGHTFPSGTAAFGVTLFGLSAYVAYHRGTSWWRLPATLGSIFIAGVVALSALTYHYPTEVIGGVLVAFAWFCFLQIAVWDSIRNDLFAWGSQSRPEQ